MLWPWVDSAAIAIVWVQEVVALEWWWRGWWVMGRMHGVGYSSGEERESKEEPIEKLAVCMMGH